MSRYGFILDKFCVSFSKGTDLWRRGLVLWVKSYVTRRWKFATGHRGSLVTLTFPFLSSFLFLLSSPPAFPSPLKLEGDQRRHQWSIVYAPAGPSDHLLSIHLVPWNHDIATLCWGIYFLYIPVLLIYSVLPYKVIILFHFSEVSILFFKFRDKSIYFHMRPKYFKFSVWVSEMYSFPQMFCFHMYHIYSATDLSFSSLHFFFFITALI